MFCPGLINLGLGPAIHGLPPGLWPGILGPLFCTPVLGLMTLIPPIILGLAIANGTVRLGVGDALPPTGAARDPMPLTPGLGDALPPEVIPRTAPAC